MIETHLSRYSRYISYRNKEIYRLENRYAIAGEDEELFCDALVKDDDLSITEYQNILKVFGAITEEQIFFNTWSFELEVRGFSYFTSLEDCKEAIDYLYNRKKSDWIVHCDTLLKDLKGFIAISALYPCLKKASPYRAHYRCTQETVKIYGKKISGSHYTFYLGKDMLANFVLTKEDGMYLIDCSKEDIWDALRQCKVVNEDFINKKKF